MDEPKLTAKGTLISKLLEAIAQSSIGDSRVRPIVSLDVEEWAERLRREIMELPAPPSEEEGST